MNKGMINRWFPGNKGYESRYILSKVTVFPAALFLCALFAVVKPVEVKADTYHGDVRTSRLSNDEDVQIDGNANIIIDSNKTIKTLSSIVPNITVTITGVTSSTLTCEGLLIGDDETGYGTLIINSANLKVTKSGIKAGDIEINGGTIETKSEDSCAIFGKDGVVVINGGNVTADGTDGIFLDSDKQITISNNAKVTATGDIFGIVSAKGNINIDNATVTATGRVDANASGISTDGNVTITDATVTAKGVPHAIHTAGSPGDNKISISGASTVVKASCEYGAAIEVARGKITISEPLEVSSPVGGGLSADGSYIATKAGGAEKAKEVDIKGHIYTVTFDANGGEGEMDPQDVIKSVKTQLNKNEFTREGYTFKEWNTEKDGSGQSYGDGESMTLEEDIKLYAQWQERGNEKIEGETNGKPAKVSLSAPKNKKPQTLVIKWKKTEKAEGYEVQYSLKKNFKKNTKKKSTAKLSLTVKKLKKGKTYYIRVRAFKKDVAGKKVYGKWSKVKTVKVKR